jgi:hypothetical protein
MLDSPAFILYMTGKFNLQTDMKNAWYEPLEYEQNIS